MFSKILNKSFITNLLALIVALFGWMLNEKHVFAIGNYALSGAITNWLAIYMLFEKVPFLYGSGVIPNRFEEFKSGIKNLIMDQFFTPENIERFFASGNIHESITVNIEPLMQSFDFEEIYQSLVDAIMGSSFGTMLSMIGGRKTLDNLKEPIIEKLKNVIINVAQSDKFKHALVTHVSAFGSDKVLYKVENIVDSRLEELTPQMVKIIVQNMIREHLGWLVVWGGVFGAIIGCIASFIS